MKPIQSALVSVYHKDGLEPLVKKLHALGVKLISTGGTQSFLEDLGLPVTPVEELTSYPSILGGRVKTLHPKIFGGILGRRELEGDRAQMAEYAIPEIDLVIVDLYPFEDTVAGGAGEEEIIEKIDIGGISLIRAAAKNFKDVLIIASRDRYARALEILEKNKGRTSLEERREFARWAFHISSHYDTAIFNYFNSGNDLLKVSAGPGAVLRYGENPHQKGTFYGDLNKIFHQHQGKELSYNNLLDIDAAWGLLSEFSEPTFVVVKHNNACGLASRPTVLEAWNDALAGDPVSAFGGILATNGTVDADVARAVNEIFFEVILAPAYTEDALEILRSKKNRMVLETRNFEWPGTMVRTVLNGILVQDRNTATDRAEKMEAVTKRMATAEELSDLEFASKICKHTKSNTIVLARNKQLLASGTGQTSRVDALRQAIAKAKSFKFDLNGAVMASDAFFPFPDCVEIAHQEGIDAVVQPGGSIKDQLSIDYCNANNMAMVFTGTRHFKH